MSCPISTSNFASGQAAADHAKHLNLTNPIRHKRRVGGRCGLCASIHVWVVDAPERDRVAA